MVSFTIRSPCSIGRSPRYTVNKQVVGPGDGLVVVAERKVSASEGIELRSSAPLTITSLSEPLDDSKTYLGARVSD